MPEYTLEQKQAIAIANARRRQQEASSPIQMLAQQNEPQKLLQEDFIRENKLEVDAAIKRRTTSAYISRLTGAAEQAVGGEDYENYSRQAGLTGNVEADFEQVRGKIHNGNIENIKEFLENEKRNKTNSFLKSFVTQGIRAADEALTSATKKALAWLDDQGEQAKLRYLNGQVEQLQKAVDKKKAINVDDPDVIALRRATIERDTYQELVRAEERRYGLMEVIQKSEAEIAAGRVFEEQVTLETEEDFKGSKTEMFFSGLGSFSYSMSSFAIGGPVVGMSANAAVIYQGAVDDARANGADEATAFEAGLKNLPAAALDAAIDRVLFTRFLKPLKGKMTVGELSRNIGLSITSGGMSEGAEQLWQNVNAKYLTKYDDDRPLDLWVLASIAMGAIFGGAPAVTSVAQMVPGFGKIRTTNPTEEEWKLIRKFETDEQIWQNRGGEVALAAANGDLEAQAAYRNLVTNQENSGESPFGPLQPEPVPTPAQARTREPVIEREEADLIDLFEDLRGPVVDQTIEDVEVRDSRTEIDPTEITPAEQRLINQELTQEMEELDIALEKAAPELADQNLSKAARELAELELREIEPELDQEILAEQQGILGTEVGKVQKLPETGPTEPVVKRSKNFSDTGEYNVTMPSGKEVQIYRDTDQFTYPVWYLSTTKGSDQQIGFTKKEALENLAILFPKSETVTEPETPALREAPVTRQAVDKKAAGFLARIVKTENALNAKISKLQTELKTQRTKAKLDQLEALVAAESRLQNAKETARIAQSKALARQAERFSNRLSKEIAKRMAVIRQNIQDRKNLVQSTKELRELLGELPRSIRGDINYLFSRLTMKKSQKAQLKVLTDAVKVIDKNIEEFNRKVFRSQLKQLVKKENKEIANSLAGAQRPSAFLDQVKAYLDVSGVGDPEVIKQLERDVEPIKAKMAEAEATEQVYQLDDAERLLLTKYNMPDLSRTDLTADQYRQAIQDIKALKKEGKTQWEKQRAKDELEVKERIGLISLEIDAMLKKKGKKQLSDREVRQVSKKLASIESAKFAITNYQAVSAMLSGKRGASQIRTLVFDKISNAMTESILAHTDYENFLDQTAKDLGVRKESLGDNDLITVGTRVMNSHQAMFVYGHSQNRAGQRHLANTEFGGVRLRGEVVQDIIDALPQNQKDFVDAMIDYNDTVMYPKINEMFRRIYGINMPKVDRYLPLTNLNGADSFDAILGEAFQVAQTSNSFLKSRKDDKTPFKSLDLLGTAYRHNRAAEHTVAMREELFKITRIFKDKDLQNKINAVSDKILPWAQDYFQDVGRGAVKPPNSGIIALMQHVRNNVRTFFIALNPGSWLKTQTPLISVMQDVGAGRIMYYAMKGYTSPMQNWQRAKRLSRFMATRKNTNRVEIAEIAQLAERASNKPGLLAKTKRLTAKAQSAAYWAYTPLDLVSTSIAWNAKYDQAMEQHGDSAKAVEEANAVVKEHFPSGRVDELPASFRSGGLEKELTIFTADMNRMFNLGYSKTQLTDDRVKEAIAFLAYSVIYSALILAMTDVAYDRLREAIGSKEPEDDNVERFWQDAARYAGSQLMGGIPGVGTATEGAIAKLTGDQVMSEMIMRQTPLWAYPAVQGVRGNQVQAVASFTGVPGGNLWAKAADEYIKEELGD